MNPLKENHEIKSLADFEALINQSKTSYTGLVESVGYVYWRSEPVYLVEIGKAMYDTDYMQRSLLHGVLLEINELNSRSTTTLKEDIEVREKLKHLRIQEAKYMDDLGIPRAPHVQPVFRQN